VPENVINLAAHANVSQLGGLDALEYALPDQVTMRVQYPVAGGDSYFNTTITSSDATWLNGTYDGWCVDIGRTIQQTNYTANVYSSYEDLPAGLIDKPGNLDAVNWLINNADLVVGQALTDDVVFGTYGPPYPGNSPLPGDYPETDPITGGTQGTGDNLGSITYGDIQRAIWALIDNSQSTSGLGSFDRARADELADRAYLYGQDFTPECDDKIAVVLQPVNASGGTNAQVTIAQVTFAELEIPCEGREETAWGEGGYDAYGNIGNQNNMDVLGGIFTDTSWAMYSSFQVPDGGLMSV
jgi:hypothetical protein